MYNSRCCLCGCSSSGRAPPCQGGGSEFEPRHPLQKRSNFCLSKVTSFFIQAAGLAYHHDAVVDIISPCGAVSHHAPACIFLRLDDIQHFVLMICNSFGIDDIHAFGVIGMRDCVTEWSNIIFAKQMHHIAARRCIIKDTRLTP